MEQGISEWRRPIRHVNVADVEYNVSQIMAMAKELDSQGAALAVFPELCVTAYTCGDLFHQEILLKSAADGIERLRQFSKEINCVIVAGAPVVIDGGVYNCGIAIGNGEILSVTPKTYLPNYNEFYEKRWFRSGPVENQPAPLLDINGVKVGIEICEDLWAPIPPSTKSAMAGAQVIVNLSASNDLIGKYNYLTSLIKQQSARCIAGYVYASAGYGESSTDLVFDGKAIIAENGTILKASPRWTRTATYEISDIDIMAIDRDRMHIMTFEDCATQEKCNAPQTKITLPEKEDDSLYRNVDPYPFVPPTDGLLNQRCEEIVNIQAAGLAKRLEATHTRNLVVGISGGLDSTLAILIAAKTFDILSLPRTGIHGVTMPGFGTTDRTYDNAISLMKALGVSIREIPIADAVKLHFRDINHDINQHDVTYENSQARERTQILMDFANQVSGMVLGTGDLSELALGWATYNGDHMSMYGVNAGVPKTLVKYLVRWFAEMRPHPKSGLPCLISWRLR